MGGFFAVECGQAGVHWWREDKEAIWDRIVSGMAALSITLLSLLKCLLCSVSTEID